MAEKKTGEVHISVTIAENGHVYSTNQIKGSDRAVKYGIANALLKMAKEDGSDILDVLADVGVTALYIESHNMITFDTGQIRKLLKEEGGGGHG